MIIFLLDIFIYQCNMLITNPKQVLYPTKMKGLNGKIGFL